jgi:hypothetical protein
MLEMFSGLGEVQFPTGTIIILSTLTSTHLVFDGYQVPFLGLVLPEFNPKNSNYYLISTLSRLALIHSNVHRWFIPLCISRPEHEA